MKVSSFAVSVQWGKGVHYFLRTDVDTAEQAARVAEKVRKAFTDRPKKRAPKPTVHVWQRSLL